MKRVLPVGVLIPLPWAVRFLPRPGRDPSAPRAAEFRSSDSSRAPRGSRNLREVPKPQRALTQIPSTLYKDEAVRIRHVDAGTGVTPVEVMRKCLDAHRAKDWDKLRRLFHPRAKIGVFAGGGLPGDPEKAIAEMTAAHSDLVYTADAVAARELDAHAVVLKGRVRYRVSGGGFADTERSWLYVVLDGQLYRSQMFRTSSQAELAYTTYGLDLGVES